MTAVTLLLHGQNKVTLPAFFRKRFPTKNFLAIDKGDALVIKPILEENLDNDIVEFYEALQESLSGKVTKQSSPKAYLKKIRNA